MVPLREQVLVALIGFLGVAHAGVLAHGPEAAAIHGGLHAAGIGELPGKTEIVVVRSSLRDQQECRED